LQLHLIFLLFLISLVFSGCGGEEKPASTSLTNEATTTTLNTSTTSKRNPTIKSITDEISRLRGLSFKKEIAVKYLDRNGLKGEVKKEIEKEYPPTRLAQEERALKKIGLLEPGDNLMELVSGMLTEEVIGYYDDETKELVVVSEKPQINLMNEITLAHEVTHALQDQNYDLQQIAPASDTNDDDQHLARLALVEGDATVTMKEYVQDNLSDFDLLSLSLQVLGASRGMSAGYLEDTLSFPYMAGEEFVNFLKDKGGWVTVDEAYKHPPDSTEQVIHPDKYIAGEQPLPVEIPDLTGIAGSGWQLVEEGTLGEFGIGELLSRYVSSQQAREAAAGWGGGRARYYEEAAGRSLLIMQLAWDSQIDADEFAETMGLSLENRYGAAFNLQGRWPSLPTSDGTWVVEEHGPMVAVVLTTDMVLSGQVADRMLGII
jgi:hypothetical protein